jgi:transcriptional regulator with XRE-family HTH domain
MVGLDETERNKRWFQNKLEERDLTYRSLAALMDMNGPDVSRIINGQRNIRAEEAGRLAKILRVPVEDILKRAAATSPISRYEKSDVKRSPYVAVVGYVDESGVVKRGGTASATERRVTRPARAGDDTIALRLLDMGPLNGWLLYYAPQGYVHDKTVGSLCIVETDDGRKLLRHVQATGRAKQYKLLDFTCNKEEISELKSASPIIWMKPAN